MRVFSKNIYGHKNLKMANSGYGGYNTQNNPLSMKTSENGIFQILGVFYRKQYLWMQGSENRKFQIWEYTYESHVL